MRASYSIIRVGATSPSAETLSRAAVFLGVVGRAIWLFISHRSAFLEVSTPAPRFVIALCEVYFCAGFFYVTWHYLYSGTI